MGFFSKSAKESKDQNIMFFLLIRFQLSGKHKNLLEGGIIEAGVVGKIMDIGNYIGYLRYI